MRFSRLAAAVAAILTAPAAPAALASSEDAWAAMRADIETKCRALVQTQGETTLELNPFGSENFGAAIVTTRLADGTAERAICIYDKTAGTAELTAPFDAGS